MTLPKTSHEAVCPVCEHRVVVPRRHLQGNAKIYPFFCCGATQEGEIRRIAKSSKKKGRRRSGNLRRSVLAKRLSKIWFERARALPCASCGAKTDAARNVFVEGHHVVRQALIEIKAAAEKWSQEHEDRILWDLRNMLPLCGTCHARQHRPSRPGQRLAWTLVVEHARKVEAFAREIGLLERARQEYV